ncbi:MAG: hypothetical protein U0790_01270 [Isosphaeraceae bacterium]
MARWVASLPGDEKDAYLVRFLAEEGDLVLRAELSKRLHEAVALRGRAGPAPPRRTVARLLAARRP